MRFAALTVTTVVFLLGLLLLFASRRRRLRDVLWVPFVYFYWSLQGVIAFQYDSADSVSKAKEMSENKQDGNGCQSKVHENE